MLCHAMNLPSEVLGIRVIPHNTFMILAVFRIPGHTLDVRVVDNALPFRFFTTRVSNLVRCSIPCQLLNSSEWFHRAFKRFAFHCMGNGYGALPSKSATQKERGCCYPFIPMFIHQVCDNNASSLIQVGIFICTFDCLYL